MSRIPLAIFPHHDSDTLQFPFSVIASVNFCIQLYWPLVLG